VISVDTKILQAKDNLLATRHLPTSAYLHALCGSLK
jgi:hypothetical protein